MLCAPCLSGIQVQPASSLSTGTIFVALQTYNLFAQDFNLPRKGQRSVPDVPTITVLQRLLPVPAISKVTSAAGT